jgi:serine/threonine protein kinase
LIKKPLPVNDPNLTGPYQPATIDQAAAGQPQHIGRYRVERVLGNDCLAIVYLAHDDPLQRMVAITVPQATLISRPEYFDAYLTEIRTVINLDQPHIVPVCDVGSTDQSPCFVVSQYIEGDNLNEFCWGKNPTPIQSGRILVQLAEALDYTHQKNLHHLHLSPNKIVLDSENKPWLLGTDFMRVEWLGGDFWIAGNPSYMSPEQVAGERTHIGAASDIFSLGLVFYEMLTGRLPYRSQGGLQLCEEIVHGSIVPPSRVKDGLSAEFDKICVTALAKSPGARYQRMKDFADAIRTAGSC